MTTLIFVEANGTRHEVQAAVGANVMQVAVDNQIDAIIGECGGILSCATCHCYVEAGRQSELPEASDFEKEMLEGALDVKDNSRLSCQLIVTEAMEGMVFDLPEKQY